jgi:hypothetical protein
MSASVHYLARYNQERRREMIRRMIDGPVQDEGKADVRAFVSGLIVLAVLFCLVMILYGTFAGNSMTNRANMGANYEKYHKAATDSYQHP